MIKNLKIARAVAEAVSVLPLDKYYPALQGNLKHVIYPQFSDIELQSEQHDEYMAYAEQVKGIDLNAEDTDTLAVALLGYSKLNHNSTIEQEAIDILSESTKDTVNTIENTILPIIADYEELYANYRNHLDLEKGLPIIVEQGLPSAIKDNIISETDLKYVAIPLDNNDKLDDMILTASEAEEAITKSGLGHIVNSLLSVTKKDTLLSGYNLLAVEGKYESNNIIETINVLTFSYIVSSSLLNNPPDIIKMPSSQFITKITKFRNNVAHLLLKALDRYKRLNQFVIISVDVDNEGQTIILVNSEQRKQLQILIGDTPVNDVIIGHVLSTSRGNQVITSDINSLDKKASSLAEVTRNSKKIAENINRSKHSSSLRMYLRDLLAIDDINITDSEKEEYHNETGNPNRVAIATDIINKLTDEQLLDDYNSAIIEIVCKSRFPYTPAISYINAMLQEEVNNPKASRHELLLYALIELWVESIIASFSE